MHLCESQDLPAAHQHYLLAVATVPESTLYRTNHAVVSTDLGLFSAALAEHKIVIALGKVI
jgi:hypothetical protein